MSESPSAWHWSKYVVYFISMTLSLLWLINEHSYESAIVFVSTSAALVGALFSNHRIGWAFTGGFVLGALLSATAAYKMLAIGGSSGTTVQDKVERDQEIIRLREQVASLQASLKEAEVGVKPSPPDDGEADTIGATTGGIKAQTVAGFLFEPVGCERQGSDIYCWAMATNLEANRTLSISFTSRIFDSSGDIHRQCDRIAGGRSGGLDYLNVELPNGVRSRIGLRFCGVANVVKDIQMLDFHFQGFSIEIQNPVLK